MDIEEFLYNLNEEVTCPLCLQHFRNPKQLPCLDNFCLSCLNRLLQQQLNFECPICRFEIEIPRDGFESLPSSLYITRLLDVLAIKNCNTSEVTCGECGGGTKTNSYCFECHEFLCKRRCLGAHNIIKTKKRHRVLALQKFKDKDYEDFIKSPLLCPNTHHKREILKFFCKLCRVSTCQICASEHFGHQGKLVQLEVAANEIRKSMEDSVKRCREKERDLSDIVRKMKQNLDEYEDNSACARSKIDKFSEELVTQIKNDDRLLRQIMDCYRKSETEVRETRNRLLIEKESFKGFLGKIEVETERCTSAKVFSLRDNVQQRLNRVIKRESECESLLDSVDTHPTLLLKQKVIDTVNDDGEDSRREEIYLAKRRLMLRTVFDICFVSLFAMVLFAIFIGSGTMTNSNSIWGVAMSNRNEIIATDFWDHKLRFFIRGKEFFSQHATFGRKGRGHGEFTRPLGIAITDKNDVIIADRNNHRVVVLKEGVNGFLNGESKSFGAKGSRAGQLLYPTGVSLDEEENIIVSDTGNHRIQVFSKHGRFIFEFGNSGEGKLNDPVQCVSIGERFFVSEIQEYNVKVYDSQGKFLFKFAELSGIYKMYHRSLVWLNMVDPFPAGHSGHTYRLAADVNRHLLVVTDPLTYRVQHFDTDGILLKTFWTVGGSSVAVAMNGRNYVTVKNYFWGIVQEWKM